MLSNDKMQMNKNNNKNLKKFLNCVTINNSLLIMKTNSTKADMKVDVCSKCHPFWTGNLKRETTGGRADKFKKKYGIQ